MNLHKEALLRAIKSRELSSSLDITPSYLSQIIGGHTRPSVDLAGRMATKANELCAALELPAPFEATDFRPDLSDNYNDLPRSAVFIVSDSLWGQDSEATAKKLLKIYEKQPEVEQQLRELYLSADLDQTIELYDGKTIRIKDTETK